ncbi:MAG TPA: hypothetical protein VG755_22595, partial [Nannocystaceae bacterium]|nr:hypothetical protein [Nannocystaceae bacterium]
MRMRHVVLAVALLGSACRNGSSGAGDESGSESGSVDDSGSASGSTSGSESGSVDDSGSEGGDPPSTMPIGIPDPEFGIVEVAPPMPEP